MNGQFSQNAQISGAAIDSDQNPSNISNINNKDISISPKSAQFQPRNDIEVQDGDANNLIKTYTPDRGEGKKLLFNDDVDDLMQFDAKDHGEVGGTTS